VSVAYTINIGRRLFSRDATKVFPPRPTRFPVSTRRHIVPAWCRDFPLAGLAARPWSQPAVRRATHRRDAAGHPLTQNRQHASTHAPHAARSSPENSLLESPADSDTRAPNL